MNRLLISLKVSACLSDTEIGDADNFCCFPTIRRTHPLLRPIDQVCGGEKVATSFLNSSLLNVSYSSTHLPPLFVSTTKCHTRNSFKETQSEICTSVYTVSAFPSTCFFCTFSISAFINLSGNTRILEKNINTLLLLAEVEKLLCR